MILYMCHIVILEPSLVGLVVSSLGRLSNCRGSIPALCMQRPIGQQQTLKWSSDLQKISPWPVGSGYLGKKKRR